MALLKCFTYLVTLTFNFSLISLLFLSNSRFGKIQQKNLWCTGADFYRQHRLPVTTKYSARETRTSGSAMAEGPRDVLVSRNSATTKLESRTYRVALSA